MTPTKLSEIEELERIRIGSSIRDYRECRGKKPDELANEVGISRSYLVNIEAGRKPLTRILLARISTALNIRPGSIVRGGYFADVDESEAVSA